MKDRTTRLVARMPMITCDELLGCCNNNRQWSIDRAYNALPERLYVLDAEGQVVFKTVAGSHGFDPEAWATAIAEHVN